MGFLFNEEDAYKPNEVGYTYGDAPEAANLDAQRYRRQADLAAQREAPTTATGDTSMWQASGEQSRAQQGLAAQMLMAQATGAAPSIAQMQASRDMAAIQAAQASAAAGARGPAALALAQQQAAAATAQGQSQVSANAQIAAAQERLAAQQAASGAYAGMRQGDLASQQQAAQQAQFSTEAGLKQRMMNDQMQMGMTGYEQGVRQSQLNARMNYEAAKAGQYQTNANIAENNAGRATSTAMGIIGAAAGAASMFSDVNAKTNVMSPGQMVSSLGATPLTPQQRATVDVLSQPAPEPMVGRVTTRMPGEGTPPPAIVDATKTTAAAPAAAAADASKYATAMKGISSAFAGMASGMPRAQIGSAPPPMLSATVGNPYMTSDERTKEPMAAANRAMAASAYQYRPEFTPAEQEPGEPNVGPMAQRMAGNPITATVVKKDPESGMLALDGNKMLKVLGGSVASLQKQIDDLKKRKGASR